MRALCISLVMALAAASSASAQPATSSQSPEALAKVYACAAVDDPEQRLACFDAAVAGMRTAETTGEFAAVDLQTDMAGRGMHTGWLGVLHDLHAVDERNEVATMHRLRRLRVITIL